MGILDNLMKSPTGRWVKFPQPGASASGRIVGLVEQQVREFGTQKPMVWDNGEPQLELLITIATDAREDEDDDGVRTIRVKGWGIQRNALEEACQKFGRTPAVGDLFRATYVRDEKKAGAAFAAKVYEYTIAAGEPPTPTAPTTPATPAKSDIWSDENPF